MAAIAECAKAIKEMGNENGAEEMKQLQRLTEEAIATNAEVADKLHLPSRGLSKKPAEATTNSEGLVHRRTDTTSTDRSQRVTRSMRAPTQQVPRVHTAASPRVEKDTATMDHANKRKAKQRRRRRSALRSAPSEDVPAGNTRAQKKQAAIRAAASAVPTAKSTRESTKEKNKKIKNHAPDCLFAKQNKNGQSSCSRIKINQKENDQASTHGQIRK